MDVHLLWFACALFAIGIALTVMAIRGKFVMPPRLNFFLNLAAFCVISLFLFRRGEAVGRCPLTTSTDVFSFLSWSLLLIYLIVGSAYRLSLMGVFTSPLAAALLVIAVAFKPTATSVPLTAVNPWVELHAALSMIAYGAFGLACVSGTMFLVQRAQLKSRHPHPVAFDLPALRDLALANRRLVVLGFVLLTLGLFSGFFAGHLPVSLKLTWAVLVWILYGALVLFRVARPHSPTGIAGFSIAAFALSLISLGGITVLLH